MIEKERDNFEIRIFQINTDHHLLNKFSKNEKIIHFIVNHHRERVKDFENIGKPIKGTKIGNITYYSYLNESSNKISYWKNFLPSIITEDQKFELKTFTYTLFASIGTSIYAIIGGNGSMVIKKFQNHRFGLELFEFLTDLNEEIVSVTLRGISGNLTLNSSTFRDGQKLLDTLNFTNIPSSITLMLKEELKNSIFDFIDFGIKNVTLEIGASFHIKHRINFPELHQILEKIDNVPKISHQKSLTSFIQVKDQNLIKKFEKKLFKKIRDDSFNKFGPNRGENPPKLDIDFIHPSKIQEFYQADYYEVKRKNAKKGKIISDRSRLYNEGLRIIYNDTNGLNQYEFNGYIQGLRTYTCKNSSEKFKAMFWQYLTCEIDYNNRPVFHIDGNWYKVVDNFKNSIDERTELIISNNYLENPNILNIPWGDESEGVYNRRYENLSGYTVFDKSLGHNIELCDILYESDNTLYFIHVKSGFDAKMRDLGNQIVIAANRFMNDRNSGGIDFIGSVLDSYNKRKENQNLKITKNEFIKKFRSKEKRIVFVLAFKSESKKLKSVRGNIEKVNSNIAKFSLIQCVREMNTLSFPVSIFEIANE